MISSASSAASSGSWVTITVLEAGLALEAAQFPPQSSRTGASSARERLVEQQHAGFARERASERHAALLTSGELIWVAILESRRGPGAEPPRRQRRLGAGAERDLTPDGAAREQRGLLGHVAEPAPLGGHRVELARSRRGRDRLRWRVRPAEQAQPERLAGTGGAEQRQPAAARACARCRARSRPRRLAIAKSSGSGCAGMRRRSGARGARRFARRRGAPVAAEQQDREGRGECERDRQHRGGQAGPPNCTNVKTGSEYG